MDGVELVDSFCMNAHKWMLTNFDCSCLWFQVGSLGGPPFLVTFSRFFSRVGPLRKFAEGQDMLAAEPLFSKVL
jgi:hypothetical protein